MPNIEFSFYHSIVESHNLLFFLLVFPFFMLIPSPGLFKHQNIFQACVVLPEGLVVEVKVSNRIYHPYDALNISRVMQGEGKKQNKINLRLHQ